MASMRTVADTLATAADGAPHDADLMPPDHLRDVGEGDFRQIGERFLQLFVELGRLQACESVLDVGCGNGRMAIPLTRYLAPEGRYHGLEIQPAFVEWCQRRITPRFPNFQFDWADVHNSAYNPRGQAKASEYVLPCADASFDFVCLTSVFTHLVYADLARYVAEVGRVLKPGGRCLATFFLLNDESRALCAAGKSHWMFPVPSDRCWVMDPDIPERAVAYEEHAIMRTYTRNGLDIEAIRYGEWCGRASYCDYQDIVVVRKKVMAT